MKTRIYLILLLIVVSKGLYSVQKESLKIVPISNGFSIEFTLPEYVIKDTTLVDLFSTTENFNYIQISEEFGKTDNIGYPQLPQLTFDLAMPYRASNFQVSLNNAELRNLL